MADAKITLETVVKSDELKQLNTTIAETNTKYKEAQAAVKEFEKACGGVASMTDEQKARYNELNTTMNEYRDVLRAANTAKNQEIRALSDSSKAATQNAAALESVKTALSTLSPTAGAAVTALANLGNRFTELRSKMTAMTTANDGGVGGFLRGIVSAVPRAVTSLAGIATAVVGVTVGLAKMGAGAQQSFARLKAFTGSAADAKKLATEIKNVQRETQYSKDGVTQMVVQLTKMGMTATQAAATVRRVSDAAYGLGKGEDFAQQLVTTMGRITMTGKVSEKQILELKAAGLDVDAAFKSMGMTADEVAAGIQNGTVSSGQAIRALTSYMGQFEGKTEEATNTFNDNFARMESSASGVLSSIGQYFADAFNQSDLLQSLMSLFDDLTALIKGPLSGAFSFVASVAGAALHGIAIAVQVIDTVINIVAVAIRAAGNAFDSACAEMRNALGPVYDFLMDIVSAIGAVLRGLAAIGAKIASNARAAAKANSLEDSSLDVTTATGHSMDAYTDADAGAVDMSWAAPTGSGGGGGGHAGGGGGGASGPSPEDLAKKQHDEDLKALQEENKLEEERLEIENKLLTIKNDLQVGAQKTLIDLQKTFGDDSMKYAAEMKEAQLEYNNNVLKETLRYKEEELQLNNKLKEAEFDGKDKEAEILRQKIALAKEQNAATLSSLGTGLEAKRDKLTFGQITDKADRLNETKVEQQLYELTQRRQRAIADILQKGKQTKQTEEEIAAAVAESNKYYDQQEEKLEIVKDRQTSIKEAMDNALNSLASGIAKTVVEGGNLVSVLKQVVIQLVEAVIQAQILAALKIWGLNGGGYIPGKAVGGLIESHADGWAVGGGEVFGPGTKTSDSILTRLSRGEYVLRADAVDRIGVPTLDALNTGTIPGFAEGGIVGVAKGGGTNVTLNVSTLDAASFKTFLRKGGLNGIKQALLDSNRKFAADKGVW